MESFGSRSLSPFPTFVSSTPRANGMDLLTFKVDPFIQGHTRPQLLLYHYSTISKELDFKIVPSSHSPGPSSILTIFPPPASLLGFFIVSSLKA